MRSHLVESTGVIKKKEKTKKRNSLVQTALLSIGKIILLVLQVAYSSLKLGKELRGSLQNVHRRKKKGFRKRKEPKREKYFFYAVVDTVKEVEELLCACLARGRVCVDPLSALIQERLEGRTVVITALSLNLRLGIHSVIGVHTLEHLNGLAQLRQHRGRFQRRRFQVGRRSGWQKWRNNNNNKIIIIRIKKKRKATRN